jgi:hypothetical protein
VSPLNTIVKSHEETERSFIHCGPFSEQWKSLKRLPLKKLEPALTAWLKQPREDDDSIVGTHLKKALHIKASLLVDGSTDLSGNTTQSTELHQMRAGLLVQKLYKTGKIIDYCTTSVVDIMLMRPVCFSVYNGAKPSLFKEINAMVV